MTTPPAEAEDVDAPSFEEQLLKAAVTPRETAAVRALADEEQILARRPFRRALVWHTDDGMEFSWQNPACYLYGLGLDDAERSFVDLVLSIASPHQTSLTRVMDLDERRLAIVLRAMITLSGIDTLAVGRRL
ncbi:hypothetical protein GCM10023084_02410 [Streptomyces lacrimifluminis]|uniref:Uncharacterized protein n=1 Tax=Streptomyces lacrimifluminis TaxID=1500077 RepID=A0A917KMY8_9ACTN|nr:hypothetical protein [Streptomyces lacrimifluminis]GGJ21507.1 hypothetical protein GCM10012282_17490 [Streptomyces lacrimifluminis]